MYQPMQRTITTPSERTLLSRSPLRRGFLLTPLAIALASLALSPVARAVPLPPPDGGYPGDNTAEGTGALGSFISSPDGNSADGNTAIGKNALFFNFGNFNTAVGDEALQHNTMGHNNTATGAGALSGPLSGGTGSYNTATGSGALGTNTGSNNTANGANALSRITGDKNTANGANALLTNQTGFNNTATGFNALKSDTGSGNTANGAFALFRKESGNFNIGLGAGAGFNLTMGNFNIDIGNQGVAGDSNTIRIGTVGRQNATFIAGTRGATVASGVGVIVGTDGQLGTVTSSERFKEAIKPMDKASEAILALKPVTFRYKRKLDPEGIPQFGLVAEQVEKVNPDLVARDDQGKVITVRYEAVNAMLLNEFLKEHRKVKELEEAIARQQGEIRALTASVKVQASQIGKVSAQVEVSKATPQMVVNNQ